MIKGIKKGQSLFELVIALGISSIILMGLVSLAATSVGNTTSSQDNSAAVRYAQEAVEFIRDERDNDWSTFSARSSTSGSNYCFRTSPPDWNSGPCGGSQYITGTRYRRDVILTTRPADSNIIDVEVIVSWDDSKGVKSVKQETVLTKWKY